MIQNLKPTRPILHIKDLYKVFGIVSMPISTAIQNPWTLMQPKN